MAARYLALALLSTIPLAIAGCGSSTPTGTGNGATNGSTTNGSTTATQPPEAPKLKPLEHYDAPPLEELDAKANWQPRPVLDSMKLRRELDAETKPLVTVPEALAMHNTSAETNEKILSALGRLPASDEDADWEAAISRRTAQDLRKTNPLLASSVAEAEMGSLTSFGLFSFDWDLNPFAMSETVKDWQASEDGLMDKVILRDDLTWSDGEPITAHDVVFSFQTIMNPDVPVPAMRTGTDQIRWIEAYDDQTLVFFHKDALATNIWNLNFYVIPKHIFGESVKEDPTLSKSSHHQKIEKNPVTGGPYEYFRRSPGSEIVLRRRESWYMHDGEQVRDKPYFREIRFKVLEDANTALLALMNGDIEEAELQAAQWETQSDGNDFYAKNTKVTGLEWTFFYFGWNTATPYFDDARVRRAMSYAFNHDEMLKELCYGLYQPCTGMFHRDGWMMSAAKEEGNLPQPYKQDLDKAQDLIEEAGWSISDEDGYYEKEVNGKKVPFEFTILVSNKPDRIAICNLLRENLASIGVKCHVQPLESAVMQERVFTKKYQAQFSGWGAGADPDTSMNIFGTGEGRNYGSYSNPEVDKLFIEGRKEFDRDKRAEIYSKINNLVWEDQPYTFLYNRASFYGFNKKLRGYMFSPRGPFHYGPGFSSIWAAAK